MEHISVSKALLSHWNKM